MKKLLVTLSSFCLLAVSSVSAQTSAVNHMTTDSNSAYNVSVIFSVNHPDSSCTGSVINLTSGQSLAPASVDYFGAPTVFRAGVSLYPGTETMDKQLVLKCFNAETQQSETHRHHIPAAPSITLTTAVSGLGEWSNGGCGGGHSSHCGGPGTYEAYDYSALVYIENNEANAFCYTDGEEGVDLLGVGGHRAIASFYANSFTTQAVIPYVSKAVRTYITCQNTGGRTKVGQIWVSYGEGEFELDANYTVYE